MWLSSVLIPFVLFFISRVLYEFASSFCLKTFLLLRTIHILLLGKRFLYTRTFSLNSPTKCRETSKCSWRNIAMFVIVSLTFCSLKMSLIDITTVVTILFGLSGVKFSLYRLSEGWWTFLAALTSTIHYRYCF